MNQPPATEGDTPPGAAELSALQERIQRDRGKVMILPNPSHRLDALDRAISSLSSRAATSSILDRAREFEKFLSGTADGGQDG